MGTCSYGQKVTWRFVGAADDTRRDFALACDVVLFLFLLRCFLIALTAKPTFVSSAFQTLGTKLWHPQPFGHLTGQLLSCTPQCLLTAWVVAFLHSCPCQVMCA